MIMPKPTMTKNMTKNKMNDMIYGAFKDLERHSKRGVVQFKAGSRPKHEPEDPIRSGVEALEICTFPCCARTAKIKPGIFLNHSANIHGAFLYICNYFIFFLH